MIRFRLEGSGEPTLIFVHGWGNDHSIWDTQIEYFAKKYRVIAVDLAGFGESRNDHGNWTLTSFAEDIVQLVEQHNLDRVVLIGFSMGAPVVVETARFLPDRTCGVVIVDFLQDVHLHYAPETMLQMESWLLDLATHPTLEKLLEGGFFKHHHEESYNKVLAMLKEGPRDGWDRALRSALQWQNECTDALKKVKAPITSINSDSQPTDIAAFRNYVPSFQAKIIPDSGHVVMWDAPTEFNRLLEESVREFVHP